MPRKIDLGSLVFEDLEFTDAKGKSWFIAGDVSVEKVTGLLSQIMGMGKAVDTVAALGALAHELKLLFASRHAEKELKDLTIGAGQLVPLSIGIMRTLISDMTDSASALVQKEEQPKEGSSRSETS